ncbi:dynein heavy chain 12, axonemal-like [Nilaparvata lugens]|uniref:dynein heavy chain 12, axonemal-like n=1 Tax=Nilaparvata lugens TaxID=108931 RepID=UPI00193DB703|nr:dynein heavy chain 12, axonemal-like [Nilaparvata lugens]
MNGEFEALVVENVENTVQIFYMEIFEAEKTFKLKCKQHAVDNYPRRYRGVVDDPDFNNWPAPLKLCHETLHSIKEFKPHIRIVSIMCNPALTDQHWKEMSELAQLDLTPDAGTTLQKLVNLNLESLFDQFEIISIGATKELQLQINLKKMYSEWTSITFVTKFSSEKHCYIVDDLDDIQALLDNHLVKTLSMRGSAFVKPVKDEVKYWYDMLLKMSSAIRDWYGIQKDWLHFQMIFSSPVIALQLSGESKLFRVGSSHQ